ncbi:MFS transporter [Photobacterium angustum]|uniref:MFS transporter n=4 Tax=Photobacterium angustum TaxID=661 RepID=A0A855SL34_PHOAN|nr:MFS transporter [Photobacterium angustum]PSW91633.1 MFS transporter [Photobacterium angustum]PSX08830.1 MFS transporter [Photobacterium angustum]PSX14445.1 MFS transporter [Photobacterium angustum]PSX22580.1 MFS transporter [Photobacterium angustum]
MASNKKWVSFLLPVICGFTVANIYYIQSIVPIVMNDLHISYYMVSMIYTISLAGNVTSLIFITPLGDFFDRKQLISILFLTLSLSCILLFLSTNIYEIYICSFFLGIGVCIIPITISYISTHADFGIMYIGKIMSGVLLGALSSRFLSSLFTSVWNWRSIYLFSSIMMIVSLFAIQKVLPQEFKQTTKKAFKYIDIVINSLSLLFKNKDVRIYSIYGFMVMAVFSAFWNNISIYLSDNFSLNQIYIGLFSLTGVAGVSVSIFSNSILKKIKYNSKPLFFILLMTFFILSVIQNNIIILAIGSIIIDAMIQLIHVNNQSNIYINCNGNESQAASCYMTSFILGGIFGSKISALLYVNHAWLAVCIMCVVIGFIGFISFNKKQICFKGVDDFEN